MVDKILIKYQYLLGRWKTMRVHALNLYCMQRSLFPWADIYLILIRLFTVDIKALLFTLLISPSNCTVATK